MPRPWNIIEIGHCHNNYNGQANSNCCIYTGQFGGLCVCVNAVQIVLSCCLLVYSLSVRVYEFLCVCDVWTTVSCLFESFPCLHYICATGSPNKPNEPNEWSWALNTELNWVGSNRIELNWIEWKQASNTSDQLDIIQLDHWGFCLLLLMLV